jgi:hypothetical protein
VEEVGELVDFDDFVGAFEEGAGVALGTVEGVAVDVEDALGEEAGTGRAVLTDEPVVVVGEEAVGDDGDLEVAAVVLEELDDGQVVMVTPEEGDFVGAAIVDVVAGAGGEEGGAAWHGALLEEGLVLMRV